MQLMLAALLRTSHTHVHLPMAHVVTAGLTIIAATICLSCYGDGWEARRCQLKHSVLH